MKAKDLILIALICANVALGTVAYAVRGQDRIPGRGRHDHVEGR